MKKGLNMGEGDVFKLILQFSIPAIIGMMVNALYNIVDRVVVGRGVGELAISGTTVAFPIMNVMMAIGLLGGIGTSTLVAIKYGEGKKQEAEKILLANFVLMVSLGIITAIVGNMFLDKLLILFGATPESVPFARDFTRIILLGAVFSYVSFGFNHSLRSTGSPKMAMYTMLISAVLNAILCVVFVFGFHMGIKGTATATIISQAVAMSIILWLYLKPDAKFKLHLKLSEFKKEYIWDIMKIGSAPFFLQIAASIMMVIMNAGINRYGGEINRVYGADVGLAASGIYMSVIMLMFMPVLGVSQGAQALLGYNFGARKFDRLKSIYTKAVLFSTAIVVAVFIAININPGFLVSLFLDPTKVRPELFQLAVNWIRAGSIFFPLLGFQVLSAGYFQAIGDPKRAMLLNTIRQIILLIPLILILPLKFGFYGIIYAQPVADIISVAVTFIFIAKEMKNINIKIEQNLQEDAV